MGLKAMTTLVKLVGKGSGAKKIITQTSNNKTLTQVFSTDGKLLLERLKAFERNNIGTRSVITRKQATVIKNENSLEATKQIYDRVYNSAGEFLGSRNVEYKGLTADITKNPLELINPKNRFVTKVANDGRTAVTTEIGGGVRKVGWASFPESAGQRIGYNNYQVYNDFWKSKQMRPYDFGFDDKGLPIMRNWDSYYNSYGDMMKASLRERILQIKNSKLQYYDERAAQFLKKYGIELDQLKHLGLYNGNPRLKVNWFDVIKPNSSEVKPIQSMFNLDNFI